MKSNYELYIKVELENNRCYIGKLGETPVCFFINSIDDVSKCVDYYFISINNSTPE